MPGLKQRNGSFLLNSITRMKVKTRIGKEFQATLNNKQMKIKVNEGQAGVMNSKMLLSSFVCLLEFHKANLIGNIILSFIYIFIVPFYKPACWFILYPIF